MNFQTVARLIGFLFLLSPLCAFANWRLSGRGGYERTQTEGFSRDLIGTGFGAQIDGDLIKPLPELAFGLGVGLNHSSTRYAQDGNEFQLQYTTAEFSPFVRSELNEFAFKTALLLEIGLPGGRTSFSYRSVYGLAQSGSKAVDIKSLSRLSLDLHFLYRLQPDFEIGVGIKPFSGWFRAEDMNKNQTISGLNIGLVISYALTNDDFLDFPLENPDQSGENSTPME